MTNTINFKIEVPNQEIDYILEVCFEGGSNYWIAKKVAPKDNDYKGAEFASGVVSKGGILLIVEDEDERGIEKDMITHELDLPKLLKGIELYCDKNKGIDFETLDAGDNDNILQYALFGELKYG